MKILKKTMGVLIMLSAPLILLSLIYIAYQFIMVGGTKDINKPVPWIIIISLFTPITIGFGIFGYYAFKGEYDKLPESSIEL